MKPIAFKTNARRMGFRELFRVAGSPGVGLLACVLKLLRLIGPDNDGYGIRALGDSLERLEFDSLPRHVLRATDNYCAKVEKLGFIPGFAYSLETFGRQEAHGQVFRHKDSLSAAAVLYVRCIRGDNESEMVTFGFNTMLTDNTYVMTSGNKRLLNKPSTFRCEFLPGRAPKDVFERHRERLDQVEENPRKIRSDDDLARLVLNCENEETEFNLERGVFVKMTRSDLELGMDLKEEYDEDNELTAFRGPRRRDEDDEY